MSEEASASVGVNPNGNPNQRDQQTSGIPAEPRPPEAPSKPTPGEQTHPTDDA